MNKIVNKTFQLFTDFMRGADDHKKVIMPLIRYLHEWSLSTRKWKIKNIFFSLKQNDDYIVQNDYGN